MRLKNVYHLLRIYKRYSRLSTGNTYKRKRMAYKKAFVFYILIITLGTVIGLGISYYLSLAMANSSVNSNITESVMGVFTIIPLFGILYSLYFIQMGMVKRSEGQYIIQPLYWFPVTWEEHTLASVLKDMSVPILLTIFLTPIILIISLTIGIISLAPITFLMLFASLLMTGLTAEIVKVVQLRVIRYISKTSGQFAVWFKFLFTLALAIFLYIAFFTITRSNLSSLITSVADGVTILWFIPFFWPSIIIRAIYHGLWAESAILLISVSLFICLSFRIAVKLNDLYFINREITIRFASHLHKPKHKMLDLLGFPSEITALVRKDLKAYLRRPDLMYVFITPLLFLVMVFIPLISGGGGPGSFQNRTLANNLMYFYTILVPQALLAIFLCTSAIGSEGKVFRFVISSPISPESIVMAKYFFSLIVNAIGLMLIMLVIFVFFQPSIYMLATGIIGSVVLVSAVGMISLASGIIGADFQVIPRVRTIKPKFLVANMLICLMAGIIIITPVMIYIITSGLGYALPGRYLLIALVFTIVIGLIITYISYRLALSFMRNLFISYMA